MVKVNQKKLSNKELAILRARFLKSIASVPSPLRTETIAMVDDEPFSWLAAYSEIKENTKTGKKILKLLKDTKII